MYLVILKVLAPMSEKYDVMFIINSDVVEYIRDTRFLKIRQRMRKNPHSLPGTDWSL